MSLAKKRVELQVIYENPSAAAFVLLVLHGEQMEFDNYAFVETARSEIFN